MNGNFDTLAELAKPCGRCGAKRNSRKPHWASGPACRACPSTGWKAGQDVSLSSLLALLPALGLSLRLEPAATEPLRASDLAQAFAHLHTPEDESP